MHIWTCYCWINQTHFKIIILQESDKRKATSNLGQFPGYINVCYKTMAITKAVISPSIPTFWGNSSHIHTHILWWTCPLILIEVRFKSHWYSYFFFPSFHCEPFCLASNHIMIHTREVGQGEATEKTMINKVWTRRKKSSKITEQS